MSSSSLDKIEDRVLNDDPDGLRHLLGEVKSLTSEERCCITAKAAGTGSLLCLKVLRALRFPFSHATWDHAAAGGHLDILRYLHEESRVPCGERTTACAAGHGHLHCLQYLHSINASWGVRTTEAAVWEGHLESLAFLLQNGCPAGSNACVAAAREGHLECLRLLHLHRCPWDELTPLYAVKYGLQSRPEGGFLCLDFAVKMGCDVCDATFRAVLERGNIRCLECLLRAGHCPKLPLKLDELPDDSQVGCLKLAVSCGVRFSAGQLIMAALLGKLEHARVLHAAGYPLWRIAVDEQGSCSLAIAVYFGMYDCVWNQCNSGVLLLPPSDAHLRACWGSLRFGSLLGAPLTPRAEALVREQQRACAQEVVRCFHAARWWARGGRRAALKWAAMSQVPQDILLIIIELADVRI